MNDIERIKDAVLLLINTIYANSQEETQKQVLKSIKDILNTSQPEGYQGLNKWYRTSIGHIIYAVSINQLNCYGIRVKSEINKETHWCNDFALQYDNINRLATESEIKEAILKGCAQKGIVEGARVKCLFNRELITILVGTRHQYYLDTNDLWMSGAKVFNNGKFAEVVKDFNCEDGNCIKQCDKCKDSFDTKPTDKELLKECSNFLLKINGLWSDTSPRGSEIKELQIKLNEHLKHE